MKFNYKRIANHSFIVASAFAITACATRPDLSQHSANTYDTSQLNQVQVVKTVEIISVLAARVAVDNTAQANRNSSAGALIGAILGAALGATTHNHDHLSAAVAAGGAIGAGLGAAAGASTPTVIYDEGVTLTYIHEGIALSSTQVGKSCEFKPGLAVMVSAQNKENETRIQPNSVCEMKKQ